MEMSGNRVRMSDGSTRQFRTREGRESFERYNEAVKHGWKPDKDMERQHRRRMKEMMDED